MKTLIAKNKQKKSKIFKISDLTFVQHNLILDDLLESQELLNPIEIKIDKHTSVMGAGGIKYHKKHYVVFRGITNSRSVIDTHT